MSDRSVRGHPTRSAAGHADDDGVDLATVLTILRRQWFVILAILALFLGAAAAYAVLTPKTWRTSTRVLLDPREKQIVGIDLSKAPNSTELGWVETRLELVKAFGTLAVVVEREGLLDDPEVTGTAPAADLAATEDPRVANAVRNLSEMVVVERPKENNLIDITVTARSPEKAARLSRAVARAFVDGLAQSKVDQIQQANGLLARQVDAMRAKMLEAETKVEEYKRANGIAVTRGSLVDEETLRQSNENLNNARTKTQEAKERWEHLRQVLRSGDLQTQSQTDGVGSTVLSRLKIDAAAAQRRRTEVEQQFGPKHPRVAAAISDIERTRGLIQEELKSLVATAEIDYQIARANEDNVRRNFDRAQTRLSDTGQASVALQDLVNEAAARRELYKSFVSRMEETNLQKNTQVSDATIVSPAQVPLRPFSPRVTLALALALVAGLGCGISVALYRGRGMVAAAHAAHARPHGPPPGYAPLGPPYQVPVAAPAAVAEPVPAAAPVAPVSTPPAATPPGAPPAVAAPMLAAAAVTPAPIPAPPAAPPAAVASVTPAPISAPPVAD
ncbi:hypothetical protein EYW49_18260, partial [Siculibacillus lacustris]